jgi:hypothetical protein
MLKGHHRAMVMAFFLDGGGLRSILRGLSA